MGRQMSAGVLAYQRQMGCPSRMDNMVNIFDIGEPGKVVKVADQRQFYKEWLNSIRNG